MNKVGIIAISSLIGMGIIPTSVSATTPEAVTVMLKKAQETGKKDQFIAVMEMAIASWPEEKKAIMDSAFALAPKWISLPTKTISATIPANTGDSDPVEKVDVAKAENPKGYMHLLDPVLWNGQAEFGAGASRGDTNETSLSGGLSFRRSFGADWEHVIDIDADYARNTVNEVTQTTKQRVIGKYDIIWKGLGEKSSIVNHVELEFDYFSGYDYRVLETLGIGYQVVENPFHKLRIEATPGFRFSRFDELEPGATSTGDKEFLLRAALDYEWAVSETMKFTDKFSVVYSAQSTTFENKAELTSRLYKKLAARLGFEWKYDTNPPEGNTKWDAISRVSLVYDF